MPALHALALLFALTGDPMPSVDLRWLDVDLDGALDVLCIDGEGAVRLLRQEARGRFVDVTARAGLAEARGVRTALAGDVDGDGRPDLALGGVEGVSLLRQLEGGAFVDVTREAGLAGLREVRALAWVDLDGDGGRDLDVASADGRHVLRRGAGGTFAEVEELAAGGGPLAVPVVPARVDRDGPASGAFDTQPAPGRGATRADAGSGTTDRAAARELAAAPSAAMLGLTACVKALADRSLPGSCLEASSVPELGLLHPMTVDFNVDPVTGWVALNTVTPDTRLHVIGRGRFQGNSEADTGLGTGMLQVLAFDALSGLGIDADELQTWGSELSLNPEGPFGTRINETLFVDPVGRVGVGTDLPGHELEVAGTLDIDGFRMETGAAAGRVLTSDSTGEGTWATPAQDADWLLVGADELVAATANVGIGTIPEHPLHVRAYVGPGTTLRAESPWFLEEGIAVHGIAAAGAGVRGEASAEDARGVEAVATGTDGTGLLATANGNSGQAVEAEASGLNGIAVRATVTGPGSPIALRGSAPVNGHAAWLSGRSYAETLGVGTSAPGSPLHVRSDQETEFVLEAEATATTGAVVTVGVSNSSPGGTGVRATATGSDTPIAILGSAPPDVGYSAFFSGRSYIETLGVGTTLPESPLHVRSDQATEFVLEAEATATTGPVVTVGVSNSSPGGTGVRATATGSDTPIAILGSAPPDMGYSGFFPGRSYIETLGVGTTVPTAGLHVQSLDGLLATGTLGAGSIPVGGPGTRMMWYPRKAAFRAGTVSGAQWDNTSVGQASVAMGADAVASASDAVAFGPGAVAAGVGAVALGTEARAFADGGVAIGTGVEAVGDDFSTALGSYNLGIITSILEVGNGSSDSARSNALTVLGNGNVGIGTTPQVKLAVAGGAAKPGGGAWSVLSDERLKRDVRPLEGSLETLLALRGVSFEYREPEAIGELPGRRTGFIAQEVEDVLPDWVETRADGLKHLTVRGFEALAVEALRELRAENAALRGELAELRAAVDALLAERSGR